MRAKNSHCSYCGQRFAETQPWPRTCSACGEVSYINPVPVAVVLLPVDDGLLLIRRGIEPHRGKLALPGGFIDWGESWQQAGARELREETGITIDPSSLRARGTLSALPGLILIFGEAPRANSADLPAFVESEETLERLVVGVPTELAFPLHNQIMLEWFADRQKRS